MTTTAPRWDLTPLYPSLDDRSFNNAVEGVYAQVDRLAALYDEFDIRETESRAVTDADVAGMEAVLTLTNALSEELQRVRAYLYALTTTDSRDDAAAAQMAEMQTRTAALGPLGKRLGAWLASLNVDDFVNRSALAAEHEFALRKAAENAELQMGEHEESLAAELARQRIARVAAAARRRLVAAHGRRRRARSIPMAMARGLATHPDAATTTRGLRR